MNYKLVALFLLIIHVNIVASKKIEILPIEPEKTLFQEITTEIKKALLSPETYAMIGLGVLGAVTYGILNDQITARLCIEYFNSNAVPHHKRLLDEINRGMIEHGLGSFPMDSPTLVAFIWGTIATWWVGLPLGIGIAATGRASTLLPKLQAKDIIKPGIVGLSILGIGAFFAGLTGYCSAELGWTSPEALVGTTQASYIPTDRRSFFVANAYAHEAGYVLGALVGIGLISWILIKRIKMLKNQNVDLKNKYNELLSKINSFDQTYNGLSTLSNRL
jgi:hypothetical protein